MIRIKNPYAEIKCAVQVLIVFSVLTSCFKQKLNSKLQVKREKQQLSIILIQVTELDTIEIIL